MHTQAWFSPIVIKHNRALTIVHILTLSKDTEKFIPKVIFTSEKFKIKICNILEKHDIRRKSIKFFL